MAVKNKLDMKELLSAEVFLLPVKTFGSVPINISLVYPNTYSMGMSNLGFHSIYYQINSRDDALCHRAFIPSYENADNITTLEGDKSINEYDIVGFSISFELDYINIIKILESANISAFSQNRNGPLVMAGGPAATFNPEPLSPFVDFFVIGEGEEVIHDILEQYRHFQNRDKQEILEALAQIKGVYVPSFYKVAYDKEGKVLDIRHESYVPAKVTKRWIKDIDEYNTESVILTPYTEFKDMFLTEVSRGCGRNCRFCMAGYCYRIPRHRSLDKVLERAEFGSKHKDKIGLVGAAVSDYPFIDQLAEQLVENNIKFSVSSLRADTLREPLMQGLAFSGHKTLTIAPEAGSDRLRQVINKGITDEHVINSVKLAHKYRVDNLKLYYIIGLPGESDEDLKEMVDFLLSLKEYMKAIGNKRGMLTVSVNPFIPKPFTPFQWLGMEPVKLLNDRINFLKTQLRPRGIKLIFESPRLSEIQSALARGDRQTGLLLYDIYKKGASTTAFKKAEIEGKSIDFYAHRPLDQDEILPWEHIDIGLKKEFFISEFHRAMEGKPTTRCTDEKCASCKICHTK
ncbi:MAG: radical SAM protein [Tepidanaerobacteraceae bacterium]|nr:radical SAM protein [Tepidanaerobacter sp.]HQA61083.1 radical SAM protein [Tepidanaerobacteraceae bacterium]HQE05068.1 radical SAM protein [Tepidanaerobacteraceae bacterium]